MIGFNVLAWSANVSEELYPILDRLKTIGYDAVEFFVGGATAENCIKVGEYAKKLDLAVTTVTVVSPEANPVSENKAVRENGLAVLKTAIDCSHLLGATVLCGPVHSAHSYFQNHEPFDYEYENAAEVLQQAGEYAKQKGIILAPEALNRFESYLCNTMEQLTYLVQKTNHPNVRAMFDSHHANMEEKTFSAAIKTISPYLQHVHISENDRGTPGFGHINFDEIFENLSKINYKGHLTIEAFSRNDPGFANAINVWRQYNDPWHIAEHGYSFIKNMCEKYGLK